MARNYFGTDGVRGIVGEFLTVDLVERLGKASALWSGGGRVFVGRDTRASGEELEEAFARGVASAGGVAVLAGVVPTPAVALLRLDLGVVISASHNPPEYNGVKFFDRDGRKLSDRVEEEIEALLDAPAPGGGEIDRVDVAVESYLEHVLERFGSDLSGMRIAVDCANGAYAGIAPQRVRAPGRAGGGDRRRFRTARTSTSAAARPTSLRCRSSCAAAASTSASRSTATATACSRWTTRGEIVDGDQIVAVLALDLGVDVVAVTTMTNLGFHRLMEERGVRVVTTDVGDRYVLEALHREGGILGGEQSGHIICLRDHVTGDGLAAALLLCTAVRGSRLRLPRR